LRDIPIGTKKVANKKFSLVYARDVVTAINKCIREKPFGHILNIAGDEEFTLKDYANMVAKELNVKNPKFDKSKQSLLPSTMAAVLDNYKAKSILGWLPTPASEWLPKVVAWNMEHENMQYTSNIIQQQIKEAENRDD
jgi:nucleoside-diphosphate-sugar epimerase